MNIKQKHIEYNPEWTPEGSRERYRWVENVSKGLRFIGASHDILDLRHRGWFLDNDFQDESVHGVVYQMPARDGQPQYVPGVSDPHKDDCAVLDFHSLTSDKRDAARWADQMAERYAEDERTWREKQAIEDRKEQIAEEMKTLYTEFRRVSREIREANGNVRLVPVVKELVRERWRTTKEQLHALRAELNDIR
jgi:hypothetical protein